MVRAHGHTLEPPVSTPRLRDITAGSSSTCAADVEGAAWCWGGNAFGQLGHGDAEDLESMPQPIVAFHASDSGGSSQAMSP